MLGRRVTPRALRQLLAHPLVLLAQSSPGVDFARGAAAGVRSASRWGSIGGMKLEMPGRVLVLLCITLVVACQPPPPKPVKPIEPPPRADLPAVFDKALQTEATDPLVAKAYLDVVDQAISQRDDRWAPAALAASLDALVWRRLREMPPGVEHAIAHRSKQGLVDVSRRLRASYTRAKKMPFMGGLIANALHDLALRVGAPKAAAKWRRLAGCIPSATVVGPLAWPPLTSLEQPSKVPAKGAFPASFRGLEPFANKLEPERIYANACTFNLSSTGPLRGLRAVVVDVDIPRPQWVYVAVVSTSAARVEIGGSQLLLRPLDAASAPAYFIGVARAEPGRVRLVARVASNQDGQRVGLYVLGENGVALSTSAPQAGDMATAGVSQARTVEIVPQPTQASDLPVAVAALLATGRDRRASQLFELLFAPKPASSPPHMELLRVRALQASRAIPRSQLMVRIESAAKRALEICDNCWEARIAAANAVQKRKGFGTGAFAGLELLKVSAKRNDWLANTDPMLLTYVASLADRAGLKDISAKAFAAASKRAAGSLMLADLDWRLHERSGPDLLKAACAGGTSRSNTRCMFAYQQRGDLDGVLAELARLRKLRGSPAIFRQLELQQLLAHGKTERALRLYEALPPARRSLAVLGIHFGGPGQADAKKRFERDMLRASDAPYAYQPLARLLGVVPDASLALEQQGAKLVKQDREKAFLPGAATAVLRHVERYRLHPTGLLHYWRYDLRRVSGTSDVAAGGGSGAARVQGRGRQRIVRRRIYKKDGRVLDPDPRARGRQRSTDLAQLQKGDYVEVIAEGWALPQDHGHLVVDTPDILPRRTSVREASIELRRPAGLAMSLWAHALLGKSQVHREAGDIVSRWSLQDQSPRRIESGVPPLEARVAVSFGTDNWERIARAVGDHIRSLDERDPFVKRWALKALGDGGDKLDPAKQIGRLVAAVGKTIRRADAGALSDFVASYGGGAQFETARRIIERGTGSRSWVLHRALRELGITSRLAIAETRPFSAAPGFPPHTGRFTHPLVRAEVDGKKLWIDADVQGPPLPPGRISPELRGRQALLATGEMIKVEGQVGTDLDDIDVRLVVAPSGDATGRFKAVIHGRPAQRLARALEVAVGAKRTTLLRNVVLGWLPWADVGEVSLSSDEGSWEVAVSADITVVGFARPEDRKSKTWSLPGIESVHVVFPRARASTLAARYTAQSNRSTALVIDAPMLYRLHRRIELPNGAALIRQPSGFGMKNSFISAERKVSTVSGNVIEESFQLNLPVGTVALDQFEEFARIVRAVDDQFAFSIRISLPKP